MSEWQAGDDWVGSKFGFIEQLPWNLPEGTRENHEVIFFGWRVSLHRILWPVVRADLTWSADDVTARAMGGCDVMCTRGRLFWWRSRTLGFHEIISSSFGNNRAQGCRSLEMSSAPLREPQISQ